MERKNKEQVTKEWVKTLVQKTEELESLVNRASNDTTYIYSTETSTKFRQLVSYIKSIKDHGE